MTTLWLQGHLFVSWSHLINDSGHLSITKPWPEQIFVLARFSRVSKIIQPHVTIGIPTAAVQCHYKAEALWYTSLFSGSSSRDLLCFHSHVISRLFFDISISNQIYLTHLWLDCTSIQPIYSHFRYIKREKYCLITTSAQMAEAIIEKLFGKNGRVLVKDGEFNNVQGNYYHYDSSQRITNHGCYNVIGNNLNNVSNHSQVIRMFPRLSSGLRNTLLIIYF